MVFQSVHSRRISPRSSFVMATNCELIEPSATHHHKEVLLYCTMVEYELI